MLTLEIIGFTGSLVVFNIAKRYKTSGNANHEIQIFSFKSIAIVIDNFSIVNLLGKGGHGIIYKVNLFQGLNKKIFESFKIQYLLNIILQG